MAAVTTCTAATEGEHIRAEALATLETRRAIYVLRGRRALVQHLLETGEATADDVRDRVQLPAGISPKLFGSVPGPLVGAGIIARAGFTTTTRPEAHARPVTVWRLADRAAALRWLAANPDQPDPRTQADVAPYLFDV